jgi:curved DNA-binding protein CbpA
MSGETPASDESVDLSVELREQIRELARALPELGYYELLGVDREAEAAGIRDAFFERSKLYHPDRYFNRNLGVYAELLHEIYKRIVVAHDTLRDPELRSTYDRSLGPPRPSPVPKVTPASSPPSEPVVEPPPEKPAKTGRSLRDRSGLRSRAKPLEGLKNRIASAQKKAQVRYQEALDANSQGDFARAAERARIAVAYDPRCGDYMDLLAEVLPKANAARATEIRRKGRQLLERGKLDEALEVLTEAAQLAPTDAGLASQLGELLGKAGVVPTAIEYALRAVELEENNVEYLKALSHLYKRDGQIEAAREHLQRAWALDPMDDEVKAELAAHGR